MQRRNDRNLLTFDLMCSITNDDIEEAFKKSTSASLVSKRNNCSIHIISFGHTIYSMRGHT